MAELFDRIRAAVAAGRYLVGLHAADRLQERRISEWQVVASLSDGRLLRERLHDPPNPAVEVEQVLPDGTAVKAVWSWLGPDEVAKLVTVHFFDE